ncbi:hypothetical protein [Lewinella sp. JB7]|uniref:hypothetical protein n=1 Tax=Lewinella sp. JB7 TaxID=2962887 RepID=UPI0020CA136E|nr:hypothetical protein [Lewinella sp. JB7]MCP9235899.1 hypothetical protein [Lewinella sp. JB7]
MNPCFTLLAWLFTLTLYGQAGFEPGYVVLANGQRQAVDIYNADWVDNPTRIRYRTPDGETVTAGYDRIAEFGLTDGSLRYVAATVKIDASSDRLAELSRSEEPVYREQQAFLELLIDGETDLLYWEEGEIRRFFYRKGDEVPVQLIRRRYQRGDNIVEQDLYRGQLRSQVNCEANDQSLRELAYDRRALVAYFKEYNACRGVEFAHSVRSYATDRFRLYARPGLAYFFGNALVDNGFGGHADRPLEASYGVSLGVGTEIVLPLANNRWAVFGELYLQRINTLRDTLPNRTSSVRLRSLNLPLGVRRYVHLGQDRALFVEVMGLLQLPWKSFAFITDGPHVRSYEATWNFGLAAGLGLRSGRWMVEGRYTHDQDVLQTYITNSTNFRSVGLVAGYRLNP